MNISFQNFTTSKREGMDNAEKRQEILNVKIKNYQNLGANLKSKYTDLEPKPFGSPNYKNEPNHKSAYVL